MNKSTAVMVCALLVLALPGCRTAHAQDTFPKFKVRADLAPQYRMFIPGQLKLGDIEDPGASAGAPDSQAKANNNQKKSRIGFSFSRLVIGGPKVDPMEDDKINKWKMLKSLPGDFANAPSYQDRLEVVGKIFEPKLTLDIEF